MINPLHNELDKIIRHHAELMEPGKAVYSFDCTPEMHSPANRLHGGVIFYVCDHTMGAALAGMLNFSAGELPATLDMSIHYFRTVKEGKITVSARVVEKSRSVAYTECDATDAEGRLLARCVATYYIQNVNRTKQG